MVALNAASGSVSWTYHVAVYFGLYQPVLAGGVLYESEIATDLKHTSSVVALRATDGSVLRRYDFLFFHLLDDFCEALSAIRIDLVRVTETV